VSVFVTGPRRQLRDALHEILDDHGSGLDWTRGVFLKPNIVFAAKPESGQITPPKLVGALIHALRELHANLDIVMGDGVAVGRDPEENFRVSGYTELAREAGVPLVDLHAAECRPMRWRFGELDLPSLALDRIYVNLPILKYSSACVLSGALKNQKGLLPAEMKKQFHRLGLHEQIAELNRAVRPSLTIMDCSRFFGPNVLISGDNCGEIDATACRLLEIDEPEHVRLSRSAGVFAPGFSVDGDEAGLRRIAARPEAREAKRLGRLRLWSNSQACTSCRAILQDAKDDMLRPHHVAAKRKLLARSIRGAEIVMGSNPRWRKEYDTVICIGSCTKRLAHENGYIYIPGCPPTLDDLYKHLP
jgi:uncharacterized protein (DUF362 family)